MKMRRLVGKAYSGLDQLQVLYTRSMVGGRHTSVMAQAQSLAELGLTALQISLLTGIPESNARRVIKMCGLDPRKGRPKSSFDGLFRSVESHALVSSFAVLAERSMRLDRAEFLSSHHVLFAVRTLRGFCPLPTVRADWERLVQALIAINDGALRMTTCGACGARHLVKPCGTAVYCPLCRLVDSVTTLRSVPRPDTSDLPHLGPIKDTVPNTLKNGTLRERRRRLRAAVTGAETAAPASFFPEEAATRLAR